MSPNQNVAKTPHANPAQRHDLDMLTTNALHALGQDAYSDEAPDDSMCHTDQADVEGREERCHPGPKQDTTHRECVDIRLAHVVLHL